MQMISALLALGGLGVGIVLGVLMTKARYQMAEVRRQAAEEELAQVEELYAAWAALKAGVHRPPHGCGPT
jgi:hypothetical protein